MSGRVLVTGASGLVGHVLCQTLAQSGFVVRAALRTDRPMPAHVAEKIVVGDIGPDTDWTEALQDVDCAIHAAARVHVMNEDMQAPDLYLETNSYGTQRLAAACARSRIRRFVFLSTVKVNGEQTTENGFRSEDEPDPQGRYAASKWRAEQFIREIASREGLPFAIVRPPLIYGPGVRANFLRLMHWVDKERLLPFGAIHNRRSLLNVWNLADLLCSLLTSPAAVGKVWMISDGEDLSTAELIRRMADAMHRKARLLSVPYGALRILARIVGKRAELSRLCGSLAIDMTATCRELGWTPRVSVATALTRTADWYFRKYPIHEH